MCFASSAKITFLHPQWPVWLPKAYQVPISKKNFAEQASASGNVSAFFMNKEKTSEDDLKQQVTAANVKMWEMIAELNLPLATANSVTYFDR